MGKKKPNLPAPPAGGMSPPPLDDNPFTLPAARNLGPGLGESLFAPPPTPSAPKFPEAKQREVIAPEPAEPPKKDTPRQVEVPMLAPASAAEVEAEEVADDGESAAVTIGPAPADDTHAPVGQQSVEIVRTDAVCDPNRKRILIIEDELGYQEAIESILIVGPFDLTICGTVEEALVKIDTQLFDLIITDINLPGLTGIQVLEKIKALDRLEVCPVVMCSSQFDPDTKETCAGLGAAGFIPKPYKYEMLISTVKAMLGVQF